MEAVILAAVGMGALFAAGAWDLGRRWLHRDETRPDPAAVEKFEIQELAKSQARISVLEQTLAAALDVMKGELADAKSERRSAAAKVAATARWEKEHAEPEPEDAPGAPNLRALDTVDPEQAAELLEAVVGAE